MLKQSRLSLSLLGLALLTTAASADIITLKTGERLDATIASETATEMTQRPLASEFRMNMKTSIGNLPTLLRKT